MVLLKINYPHLINCYLVDELFFKKNKKRKNQDKISNNPPIGVIKPITLKLKEVKSFVAKRYIEPENKRTPEITRFKIILLYFSEIAEEQPINNKNKA